jgi:hypothetical protein
VGIVTCPKMRQIWTQIKHERASPEHVQPSFGYV